MASAAGCQLRRFAFSQFMPQPKATPANTVIGGMTKTIIGFAVGVLGSQFNLSSTVPRLVMFVAATFLHELMFEGLHAMIGGRPFGLQWSATLIQALVNGLVGVTVFLLVERGPEAVQRRRMGRGTFGRKRF